jgi:hypothetical protein
MDNTCNNNRLDISHICYMPNEKIEFLAIIKNTLIINPDFICSPEYLAPYYIYHKELLETGAFDLEELKSWIKINGNNYAGVYTYIKSEEALKNSLRMTWITACIIP